MSLWSHIFTLDKLSPWDRIDAMAWPLGVQYPNARYHVGAHGEKWAVSGSGSALHRIVKAAQ